MSVTEPLLEDNFLYSNDFEKEEEELKSLQKI